MNADCITNVPTAIPEDVTGTDHRLFMETVSTRISAEQEARIVRPVTTFPRQQKVLAIHWHPEFVPMEMIRKRLQCVYPGKTEELIIPTQHNVFTAYGDYCGVEVDCCSTGFNQKVQLLLHFRKDRLQDSGVLQTMVAHTFKYRSSQLFEFMHSITKPDEARIEFAARETGAGNELIRFTQIYVRKVETLMDTCSRDIPPEMIKNRILRDFFDGLRPRYGNLLIDRVQTFLKAVKTQVKADFSLQYFYRTSEIIEEARAQGAGIVIPHPEQFWPILLADYDVDGFEVWNPQSRRYTEFLISVINNSNERLKPGRRPLLVFMGDDTHMSEKVRDPGVRNPAKAGREIGYQPAWEDSSIRQALIKANVDRHMVIAEYKHRLAG